MSVSTYKQLNAKMDIKHITYFTDINGQKMAKNGVDVSARDIRFAHQLHSVSQELVCFPLQPLP
jgi:hypothetical protein